MSRNRSRFSYGRAFSLATTLAFCGPVLAQTLVSRQSEILYGAVYGGGEDAFTPSGQVIDSTPLASDLETLQFSDSQSGLVIEDPDRPWAASVSFAAQHQYVVTGPLSDFTSIVASGNSVATAAASGEGLADLASATPGNQVLFYFDMNSNQPARLLGNISFVPDGYGNADVRLERFDGFTWGIVFWSAFMPDGQGSFDQNYALTAGQYRIYSAATVHVFHGIRPAHDSRFDYRLNIGPPCPGDLDGDNDVDLSDLAALLSHFGVTSGALLSEGDLDDDGDVDLGDLTTLLSQFGSMC